MLSYERADGVIEQAMNAEEAIRRCPVLGSMALEEANVFLELMAEGQEIMAVDAKQEAANGSVEVQADNSMGPENLPTDIVIAPEVSTESEQISLQLLGQNTKAETVIATIEQEQTDIEQAIVSDIHDEPQAEFRVLPAESISNTAQEHEEAEALLPNPYEAMEISNQVSSTDIQDDTEIMNAEKRMSRDEVAPAMDTVMVTAEQTVSEAVEIQPESPSITEPDYSEPSIEPGALEHFVSSEEDAPAVVRIVSEEMADIAEMLPPVSTPPNLEVIREHVAEDGSLEVVLAELGEYFKESSKAENSDHEETEILHSLGAVIKAIEGIETDDLAWVRTVENFLQDLGYDRPERGTAEFIEKYDAPKLCQALRYIYSLANADNRQEFVVQNSFSRAIADYEDPITSRWGRALLQAVKLRPAGSGLTLSESSL